MYNFNKRAILFLLGMCIGSFLAIHFKSNYLHKSKLSSQADDNFPVEYPKDIPDLISKYNSWFVNQGYTRKIETIDQTRYKNKSSLSSHKLESDFLNERIKIACIIFASNIETANAAKSTWAKTCSNVIIIKLDTKLPVSIKKTKHNSNWNILCNVIKNLKMDKIEWAVFVNDQTFVIMENLRWMLAPLNYSQGYYLGQADSFWGVQYNNALAGYVLSKESLKLLKNEFDMTNCVADRLLINKEDFILGKTLSKFNIFPVDTRDEMGYSTFNAYNWQQEFFPGVNYYKNSVYPRKCCSSRVVTFKGIEKDKFYMYYYLLYQLSVFSTGELGNNPIKPPKDKDYVWKKFLAERGIYGNVSAQEYYRIWEEAGQDPEMFAQLHELVYN